LSKHWDLPSVWNAMKPLLFWNWKLMGQGTAGAKEGSNMEEKDVAELVSKLDAKHNVKVAAHSKGQKSNHSLIEGSDKGAISPVIQPKSSSRDTSSRPGTTVLFIPRNKIQDSKQNIRRERRDEHPRCVLSQGCTFLQIGGNKRSLQ